MDAVEPISISPRELYDAIGAAAAPFLIDVRRGPAFAADHRMIVGAIRRNPDEIEDLRRKLPTGRAVVVYCVHGHEVSQQVAAALHSAGAEHKSRRRADAATKATAGLRAVSIYPQLQNGHAVAEVTLLQGTTLKKATEKLD